MNKEEDKHNLDERLEELLGLGWILLPESCTLSSCNCPLVKSPNGEKYCTGCDAWQFEHVRPKTQNELVAVDGEIKLKDSELQKRIRTKSFDFVLNQSVIRCLQTKLYFLTTLLNSESDLSKIKDILTTINMCLENIRLAMCTDQ